MNLLTVMQQLYASELSSGLQWTWDAGFEVLLGDPYNGLREQHHFGPEELEAAAAWLDQVARAAYPDSDYAQRTED
jgi:hypothetical protein